MWIFARSTLLKPKVVSLWCRINGSAGTPSGDTKKTEVKKVDESWAFKDEIWAFNMIQGDRCWWSLSGWVKSKLTYSATFNGRLEKRETPPSSTDFCQGFQGSGCKDTSSFPTLDCSLPVFWDLDDAVKPGIKLRHQTRGYNHPDPDQDLAVATAGIWPNIRCGSLNGGAWALVWDGYNLSREYDTRGFGHGSFGPSLVVLDCLISLLDVGVMKKQGIYNLSKLMLSLHSNEESPRRGPPT